jgi:hypothetical protein
VRPFAGALTESKKLTLGASRSLPRSERANAAEEAALFVDPLTPAVRSSVAPTTRSILGQASNNSDAAKQEPSQAGSLQGDLQAASRSQEDKEQRKPREERLTRAHPFDGDLRNLSRRRPIPRERTEPEEPEPHPAFAPGTAATAPAGPSTPAIGRPSAPAPAPLNVFEGLDRFNWGAGSPPDTNGDVGPNHYIQTVNTSIGIFRKSDGFQEAAFTFDTFMSQGNFGNLCDTNNFGDPVVLYDTFEDRWIITDFAFLTDISGNVLAPAYQCIAASKTGNPVTGGWNFYSIQVADSLNDYPKLGIWPDGLYMSANMFSFGAGSAFKNARVWAFNKAQMYAGSPTVKVVTFDVGGGDFAVMPSNARLQTGTPPPGRPNLFISSWLYTNALSVYKFHVDWNSISLSTFTGPDVPLAATSWPNAAVANAAQPGTATLLDVLQIRAMVQNQYTNFGGTESLWVPHTVRRGNTSGFAAPRWYQVDVTGSTVAGSLPQATTWDPDGANVINRFMPSLALDRAGNMALGYSTSSGTVFPSIAYAGRLAADPVNTFSQTEQTFFTGTASQTGTNRWGDYSAMTLDPDGCTFWYTIEYANPADQTFNHRWLTKFGSFRFAECTQVGAGGTISGTVTTNPGGAPIVGATVELGARSTTTNGSGIYSFTSIPAGTYPLITASFPGAVSASASSIVVTDGGTTTQDFSLAAAPTSACVTDTTQSDFLTGVSTNLDLSTSPGDATLTNAPPVDQSNTAGTTTGTGFGTPAWTGQTFIPAVNGLLAKADVQLFCNGCGATPPNLTLSVRNTSAGLPAGADLASATIPGSAFASGSTVTYTASFGSPATLTSGTQYALILRPVSAPAGSGYFWIRSSPTTYANGSRVLSADSGGTWSPDTTRDYNFKTYMQTGYAASGNLVSSPKDANPAGALTPIWSTFSWNATVPANTSLQFQLAGSNSVNGPFNFVGPDGTAATFFTTSPASFSPQFYNFRFLEYKALFATTDPNATPTLNDATACFNDVDCSTTLATITPSPAAVCANTTGNTASGPAGMTAYAWGITNGTITSAANTQSITYTAGASGTVTLSLTVTGPNGCIVANSATVTINPIPATPTITPGGPTTFCAGGSVSLSSSSASGNQWFLNGNPIGGATNQVYNATASGSYTVVTTASGCASAASAATVVTVNPIPPTPTITPGGPTTFCAGNSVGLTSSSASGNQWFLNGNPIGGATSQLYSATASGSYTVKVTNGNSCTSAPSAATTVTVNPIPATPTITPGGPTTFCAGGSVGLTSSSASGNQWFLNGNPIGGATSQLYSATASGNYTVTTTASGCTSPASAATVVTVNPIPATPTITPTGSTTFCSSLGLTSSSASGNQWYLNGNPIGGATAQTYNATAAGSYTVVVTASGCASAASAATTLTANTPPVLTYQTQTTAFKGALTINPATGPSDNVSVSSIAVQSQGTYTGTISVNNTNGVVSISNAAPVGTHTIVIRATDNCGTNTDASFTLTVQKAATTTALSSSLNPSDLGQNVTFTATVTSTAGALTGTAQFKIDGTNSGSPVTLNGSGVATLSISTLTAGTHTIAADYSGDVNCAAGSGTLVGGQLVNNRPLVSFSLGNYPVNESSGFVTITVNRTGDLSVPVTVDYATDDTGAPSGCGTLNSGMASARCDFDLTLGTLTFAATETQKTFVVPITQDSYTEGPEMFTVNLSNLTGVGAAFTIPSSATVTINDSTAPAPNANDDTDAFVRQHYRDFLNREADAAGLSFWAGGINNCTPKPQCTDVARINTSAAFFLSIEFQSTGNLVRSFYVAALDRPLTNNMPGFAEFERDTQAMQRGLVVGQGNWQQTLNDNRDAFMRDFVTRADFVGLYPTTDTPTQYVNKLFVHAAITPTSTERNNAIAEFGSATTANDAGARGRALLDVTQNTNFQVREMNRSFVQMEYFGYLRRNPNDAPDGNFTGYDFWVTKLNNAGGNFVTSEMVKAFISSSEYRRRFGP